MAVNAATMLCLAIALVSQPVLGDNSAAAANPIRRVVTLLQNMAKKVAKEGAEEKELFDKFICYCQTSGGNLQKSISENTARVPQLQSDIEAAENQKLQAEDALRTHQTERDAAKQNIKKATAIREKEHAAFSAESGSLKADLDALAKATAAIEKGMSGGFLQSGASMAVFRRVLAMNDDHISDVDREMLTSFLQGGSAGTEGYAPKSGQIVGILKQMHDDFSKDLEALETQEATALKNFEGLVAALTKEIAAHTAAIEKKTAQIGELAVSIVNMKNDLTDSEAALIEDKKFLADLEGNCNSKKEEMAERVKTRAEELAAIHETIKILNDDDALELFKKTLPSPAASSLLEVKMSRDHIRHKALEMIMATRQGYKLNRPQLDFVALMLSSKKVDFSKVIKMIDDMVALLAQEQADDDHKKEYCAAQIDFTEDKAKELKKTIEDLDTAIADHGETIKQLTDEIASLTEGIKELDKQVAEATEQRQKEHAEFEELIASDSAAKEILGFAKNRLNKFYNPKLYKPPPKVELSEEGRIAENMAFVQISAHVSATRDAPPPPPETFGAYQKKGEQSTGVLAMIDLLVQELDKEMTEAGVEEKNAQKDYEQLMADSAAKRVDDSKSVAEKQGAKADTEGFLSKATEDKKAKSGEFLATGQVLQQLHNECDWLLQNFDLRKTARAEEVDALKNAKAVLAGADFSAEK